MPILDNHQKIYFTYLLVNNSQVFQSDFSDLRVAEFCLLEMYLMDDPGVKLNETAAGYSRIKMDIRLINSVWHTFSRIADPSKMDVLKLIVPWIWHFMSKPLSTTKVIISVRYDAIQCRSKKQRAPRWWPDEWIVQLHTSDWDGCATDDRWYYEATLSEII